MIRRLNSDDFEQRYRDLTGSVRCLCEFTTELVGGVPADEAGIRLYVEHKMGIATDDPDFEGVVQRTLGEIGDKPVTPPEGEIQERSVYGVNVIRRTAAGPYVTDWMVKACMKQAASRYGIFAKKHGAKGDVAEAGQVRAVEESLIELNCPWKIFLFEPSETGKISPPKTYFQKFMGRITGAQGAASIVHDSECVPAGTRFMFEFRFLPSRYTEDDVISILALAGGMGLGSSKALERGKFKILDGATIDLEAKFKLDAKPKAEKKPKAKEERKEERVVEKADPAAVADQSSPMRH